ncbi:MBL fold metallo-hydrolase [Rhodohalobacter sp. SW132]|uniref:MBL fold metallo-hydrolase n=1 Tax=Rhodohalobacter sp. SW132 TaxID=2293433 RepID=UPI000E266362|nr:MBL fold metallo-hydrolase [Rhodohalobacter sp. SW132]REL33151.1 MBL fold metallo-hydrolase [Rhodohalobacter sp. SW132]
MADQATSIRPVNIGNLELYSVETGRFMLDGGAMFGVVPKTLWSKKITPDDKNRIPMAARCLLIRSKSTDRLYLVDNGCGDKFNEKMSSIYSLDFEHSDLERSLDQIGVQPEDVTDLVFTHLHFDHCGGTTTYNAKGDLEHRFSNAIYHVNKRHWETATHPNAREKASFLKENIQPISEYDKLNLVDDRHVFEDGFSMLPFDGHTIGQQLPFIYDDERSLVYAADLIPTYAHVPLPWVMGYDMHPLQTLTEKEPFLNEAAENGWYLYLEHDANHEIITIQKENGKFSVDKTLRIRDLV